MLKEFTKDESKILKGIAILFMVGLHVYMIISLWGIHDVTRLKISSH